MTPLEAPRPKRRPLFIVPTAVALFLLLGVGPNIQLAFLSCTALAVGVFQLWRPGELLILLYVFGFQWLQASLIIFYANLRGMTLVELNPFVWSIEYAIVLSLIGVVFLSFGMRQGAGPQDVRAARSLRGTIAEQPATRWFFVYVVAWLGGTAFKALAILVPGLSQPLLAAADMKWAAYLVFTIATFSRMDSSRLLWLAVFCFELLMSLGGYFSSFRPVFLFTLIALGAIGKRLSVPQAAGIAAIGGLMFVATLYWTVIKSEYREFVSGGESAQVVTVDYSGALAKIVELVWRIDSESLITAADRIIERLSEADLFSTVLDYVPDVVPHQHGDLWMDAISRSFMPRLFFPEKRTIDESELTRKYTGVAVAGAEEGTQISLGYLAESYIDFGEVGMMGAIFVFGYVSGRSYRWFLRQPGPVGALGIGFASAMLFQQESLAISSAKAVSSIALMWITWLYLRIILPHCIGWLRG